MLLFYFLLFKAFSSFLLLWHPIATLKWPIFEVFFIICGHSTILDKSRPKYVPKIKLVLLAFETWVEQPNFWAWWWSSSLALWCSVIIKFLKKLSRLNSNLHTTVACNHYFPWGMSLLVFRQVIYLAKVTRGVQLVWDLSHGFGGDPKRSDQEKSDKKSKTKIL